MIEFISIDFESNGSYVLGTREHGNSQFGLLESVVKELVAVAKGIGSSSSMLVKHFRSRANV